MRKKILPIIEWAVRINIFIKLSTYGLGKILNGQFYLKGNIPAEIGNRALNETSSYDLAWSFFGHSKEYILFIGVSQIIGALLFLIPKTKLLGGAVLVPILMNIVAVDLFFGVARGALFSACFYLLCVLWVFYLERKTLVQMFRTAIIPANRFNFKLKERLCYIIGIAVIFGGIFILEYWGIAFFGYEDH